VTREQFEHAIRAAGAVVCVSELLVIGSQAVHGSMTGPLPIEAARSVEVDVAVRGDSSSTISKSRRQWPVARRIVSFVVLCCSAVRS